MHEMSIANAILQQALEVAAQHGAKHVAELEVSVGELRQVVPDALHCAFRAVCIGTAAEGAKLRLTHEPIGAVCGECAGRYQPTVYNFACPHCGAAAARIVAGNDIVLESVVCDARSARGVA